MNLRIFKYRSNITLSAKPAGAFSLLELLIVIIILAILAAVAVPNLIEMQTRAKVAVTKSDLRTLASAIEAYAVDHDKYPTVSTEASRPIVPYPPIGFGPEFSETRISIAITTPVAYIKQRLNDPFAALRPDLEDPDIVEDRGYHYSSLDYASANNGTLGITKFKMYVSMMGNNSESAQYFISGHGPDRDHDDDESMLDRHAAVYYDPTNGTVSSGDIVGFGPGLAAGR